jgi:hypothetical protein
VGETPDEIRKHIDALDTFERRFGTFIVAVHNDQIEDEPTWTRREYAERKRELQMLAPRAERAMRASGVEPLAVRDPMTGITQSDLPSQLFDFIEFGDGLTEDDGLTLQRAILDRIPSQSEGLKMRLEEAEADGSPGWPRPRLRLPRWAWLRHPLIAAIVGGIVATVIGGLIVAAILGLFN